MKGEAWRFSPGAFLGLVSLAESDFLGAIVALRVVRESGGGGEVEESGGKGAVRADKNSASKERVKFGESSFQRPHFCSCVAFLDVIEASNA